MRRVAVDRDTEWTVAAQLDPRGAVMMVTAKFGWPLRKAVRNTFGVTSRFFT